MSALMLIIAGITFGIAFILSGPTTILFIGFKLFNVITWSWEVTLIPFYIFIFSLVSLFIINIYSKDS